MLRFSKSLAAVFMSAVFALIAFMLLAASTSVEAGLVAGGDVAEPVSASQFSCLKNNHGWEVVVVRAYQSFGRPDPNARSTLLAASQAGIPERGIYVFPCRSQSASTIASDTLSNTPSSTFKTVWLDIEMNPSGGCGWGGDYSSNCQYLGELIDAFRSHGVSVGIYSSVGEWGQTVGDSCTIGKDKGIPLWFARYNGVQDYSDFIPFGGWSLYDGLVYGHQWNDNIGGACGVSADADVFGPAGSGPVPPPPPPPGPGPSPSGGGCNVYYEGLCPGASNCMCTDFSTCGLKGQSCLRNWTKARNANGGCSGQCRSVIHGECLGNAYCLKSSGPC